MNKDEIVIKPKHFDHDPMTDLSIAYLVNALSEFYKDQNFKHIHCGLDVLLDKPNGKPIIELKEVGFRVPHFCCDTDEDGDSYIDTDKLMAYVKEGKGSPAVLEIKRKPRSGLYFAYRKARHFLFWTVVSIVYSSFFFMIIWAFIYLLSN